MKRYGQLTLEERYQIFALRKAGWTQTNIGRFLGRSASTISRELRRNLYPHPVCGCDEHYRPSYAHTMAHQRRLDKGRAQRKIQGSLQEVVEQKLFLGWSPEQIAGRLWGEQRVSISHETIYQHVLRDTHEQSGPLRYCLRFGGYKQHRYKKSKAAVRTRERKNWLDERPTAANKRRELGHWERDSLLGSKEHGGGLLTIVDRRSRYLLVQHVQNVDTEQVTAATQQALKRQPHARTMTNDNGSEFARDVMQQEQLGLPIYFCEPSSPWQRGTVENTNGLLRQYIPKGANLMALQKWVPRALEETLNFRPRKTLGFRTPYEVHFNQQVELLRGPLLRLGLEFSSPP